MWKNLILLSVLGPLLLSPRLARGLDEEPNLQLAKPDSLKTSDDSSKVRRVPTDKDDVQTEQMLNNLLKEAGWFPYLAISVKSGVVFIEGHVADKNHLDWLATTADRLPTVVAVINKATLDEPPISDFTPAKKEIRRLLDVSKKRLPLFGIGILLSLFFGFLARMLYKLARKFWASHVPNAFLLSIVSFSSLLPVYAVMFYLILTTLGMSGLASTIIGGTGILGIVIGLAFKDIAENFLSGMLLAIRSPFVKGDEIKIGEIKGTVQDFNMRGTTVMDSDGNLILIPNSLIIHSVITNTNSTRKGRTIIPVTVSYDAPLAVVTKIVKSTLSSFREILPEPAPYCAFDQLGPNGVTVNIYYWVDNKVTSSVATRSKVIFATKCALTSAGISLPDLAREVILKRLTPLQGAQHFTNEHTDNGETKGSEDAVKRIANESRLPGNANPHDILK